VRCRNPMPSVNPASPPPIIMMGFTDVGMAQ
jgi:hypothetical protein